MSRTVLHVDSSIKGDQSDSRKLSGELINLWKKQFSGDVIRIRDIISHPLPHIDGDLLAGLFTAEASHTKAMKMALERADELLEEFMAADVVVIGAPMYNFGIPSPLKAWIDYICRAGRTFAYSENGPVGLVKNKKILIVSTRGSIFEESPMDHQETYLQTVFGFLGIDDIQVIRAEGLALGDDHRKKSLIAAEGQIVSIVAGLKAAA